MAGNLDRDSSIGNNCIGMAKKLMRDFNETFYLHDIYHTHVIRTNLNRERSAGCIKKIRYVWQPLN